jgi:hypothetical protein
MPVNRLIILPVFWAALTCASHGAQAGDTVSGWLRQESTVDEEFPINIDGFQLKKRAKFSFTGRVLSSKAYSDEPQSKISPGDIVISWGRDPNEGSRVFQQDRWYFFSKNPRPREDMFRTTANLHLVGEHAERALSVKPSRLVEAEGWLVDILGPGGFKWETSLTRDDMGDGACEIFLIGRLKEVD